MRAYRAAVMSGIMSGPALFLDTDISLRKDFVPVFDGSFDVGLAYRAMLTQTHMPLNEGVILADLRRPSSVASGFGQWLALYDWMATLSCPLQRYGFDIRKWRGGQLSLAAFADWRVPPYAPDVRDINGVRCRFFPCDTFNFAVKSASAETLAAMSDKWAFHFKGAHAKETMRRVASMAAVQSAMPSAS